MKVDWAIPCRYVEVQSGGGATIVGAGADLVRVLEFPCPVQVLFAVRFLVAPDELEVGAQHGVACRSFNAKGEQIGELSGELSVGEVTQQVPGYIAEIIVPMAARIEAREAGTYRFEFEVDGDVRGVPVHIFEADPPAPQ